MDDLPIKKKARTLGDSLAPVASEPQTLPAGPKALLTLVSRSVDVSTHRPKDTVW